MENLNLYFFFLVFCITALPLPIPDQALSLSASCTSRHLYRHCTSVFVNRTRKQCETEESDVVGLLHAHQVPVLGVGQAGSR